MAASFANPFEVTDFSHGVVDHSFLQDYQSAKEIDNLFITSDAKLKTRPGSEIDNDDPADDQIPAGVQRIGTLINYDNDDTLLVQSGVKIYFRDPAAYDTLQGPTGNDVFSTGNLTNAVSYSQWNKHLFVTSDAYPRPMKIYKDDAGDIQVRTSGLPFLATDPVITVGAAGANDYIYAFHYEYLYMAGNQEFEDVGAVTHVPLDNSDDPGTNPNAITGIPVISNGATDNWDTTVIKVFIFRTLAGGNVFYKIGEVTNGTTVFSDTFSDSAIQENDLLYTNDGTLDFDPVPESQFVHVVNNTGYYGSIQDGSEIFQFRIRQSVPGDPDSCPLDFFLDLEDNIKGISSVNSIPVVLCRRHIYRLENNFDQFGRGGINPVRISDTAGCVSNLSLVQAEQKLFWAGNDGFYATDGYQVWKISDNNNERYKDILEAQSQTNRIIGKFDEKERRIYWALERNSSSLDNDSLLALELRYGVKPDSTFTTWSGNSFRPTAIEFFAGSLYRADTRGYIFIHNEDLMTDPKIDITEDAEDWNTETIIWTYQSININFGGTFFRKIPSRILISAANETNTTIQVTAINDDGKLSRDLNPIRWRGNFIWGDQLFVWGNPSCVWGTSGLIEQFRRFPSGGLRLSYLSIVITNGFSPIINSDAIGIATFDQATSTVALDTPAAEWPFDSVDYFIYTEVDNYTQGFLIDDILAADEISVIDPNTTLPTGSFKWVIKGYQKGELLHLLSYNIFWSDMSQTQTTFHAGDSGLNA